MPINFENVNLLPPTEVNMSEVDTTDAIISEVNMSDANTLPASVQQKNLLYDFYGGLLTEKQRSFFVMHYMEDLSLAEIGEHYGITPQAVADLLKRANNSLNGYESKLGLVKKLSEQKESARAFQTLTDELTRIASENSLPELSDAAVKIQALASEMML